MAKNKNTENNQEDLLKQQENTTPPNQEGENQGNGQDISLQQGGENAQGTTTPPNQEGVEDGKPVVDVIFGRYPNINRYYKTSDGTSFFKKTDATGHAQKLKDKNITEINR